MSDPQLLAEASNPSTPAARLAELVVQDPSLGAAVARHPNVYPGLLEWLASNGDPAGQREASAALAGRAPGRAPQLPPVAKAPSAAAAPSAPAQQQYQQPQASPSGQPTFGQQGADAPADQELQWHPGTDDAPRKRRPWVLITAIALVVALVAGGGAWWWFGLRDSGGVGSAGQATPEEAAKTLLSSLSDKDLLTVVGAVAPSEANVLTPLTEQLEQGRSASNTQDIARLSAEALDLVEIKTDGLELSTEDLEGGAGEVSVTTVTAGTLTVSTTDEQQLAEKIAELQEAVDPTSAESADEIRGDLDLPHTSDFADFSSDNGYDFPIVTVKENDQWYTSLMLTAAENAFQSAKQYDSSLKHGTLVTADQTVRSETPEAALKASAEAIVDGANTGDYSEIARTLPTAERRLVSLYGDSVFDEVGSTPSVLSLDADGASTEIDGDKAKVLPDDYTFSFSSGSQRIEVIWSKLEFTIKVTSSSYSSYNNSVTVDLAAPATASELGIDQVSLVAVQEDGSWYFSPLATIAEITQVIVPKVTQLSDDGRLDSVLEEYGEDIQQQLYGY